MIALRENKWDGEIIAHAKKGRMVIGICGGFQILGRKILDPDSLEGNVSETEGLGLLDMITEIGERKLTRNSNAIHLLSGLPLTGYEIHMGNSFGPDCRYAPLKINNVKDGAASPDGKIWGTYLHGLFSADAFRHYFIENFGAKPDKSGHFEKVDNALDKIADELEKAVDVDTLFRLAR